MGLLNSVMVLFSFAMLNGYSVNYTDVLHKS